MISSKACSHCKLQDLKLLVFLNMICNRSDVLLSWQLLVYLIYNILVCPFVFLGSLKYCNSVNGNQVNMEEKGTD